MRRCGQKVIIRHHQRQDFFEAVKRYTLGLRWVALGIAGYALVHSGYLSRVRRVRLELAHETINVEVMYLLRVVPSANV